MKIYIEYVLFDNFIITFLILLLICITLKNKIKFANITFCSTLGSTFAILLPIITLETFWLIILKLIMGGAIILPLKKYKNFAEYLVYYLLFLSFTFLIGGFVFGLIYMFNLKTTINGLLISNFEFPMSVIIIFISFYCYIMYLLIKYIKNNQHIRQNSYKVNLIFNGCNILCNAFYDTGNCVLDKTQSGIIIIDKKTFSRFKSMPKNIEFLSIKSVASKNKLLTFYIDELDVEINGIIKKFTKVCVGISKNSFQNFDVLLHKDYI